MAADNDAGSGLSVVEEVVVRHFAREIEICAVGGVFEDGSTGAGADSDGGDGGGGGAVCGGAVGFSESKLEVGETGAEFDFVDDAVD